MKSAKWMLAIALLVVLALSIAACGGEEPTAPPEPTKVVQEPTNTPVPEPTDTPLPPPTDTPLPEPTDTPLPEPTEEPEESFDLSMLEQPGDLDSFRSTMEVSWEATNADGTEETGSFALVVEFVREPFAQHVIISGDMAELEEAGIPAGETLEMYVVEGTMYINMFGSWMSGPADEGGMDTDELAFVATGDLLEELKDAKYEGKETYNGIETRHYSFDKDSFDMADLPEGAEIEEASGHIYIAVEGNYVVHMEMMMSGTNLALPTGEEGEVVQTGTFGITMDLSNINEPITIEVPEEAMEAGAPPEDLPIPADAEEVTSLMGMITFQSPSTPEEVAEFYQTGMPENGWTEVSVDEMSGMYMLEYSKEGRTASFMITVDSDTGNTSVLITVSEE
jgi:hypothetical protein